MPQNNTKVPVLEFGFVDDSDNYFDLTHSESQTALMPPWLTSFSYVRRANALGAGTWTISLVDPTFTLMDILNQIYSGQSVTESDILNPNGSLKTDFLNSSYDDVAGDNMGRVRFRYGHKDGQGIGFETDEIYGWVKKISPSITSKLKLSVNITGIDVNPNTMTAPLTTSSSYFNGVTLEQSILSFVNDNAQALGIMGTGITYDNNNTALGSLILEDKDMANGNLSFFNTFLVRGHLTLPSFLLYLQTLLVDEGIKLRVDPKGEDTALELDSEYFGMPFSESKNISIASTQLNIVVSQINVDTTPTFYINTQQTDFNFDPSLGLSNTGAEGDSRVISFDPTIEPLMPSMLGARRLTAVSPDPLTLEPVEQEMTPAVNEAMVSIGDQIKTVDTSDRDYTDRVTGMSLEYARMKMKFLNGWLCTIPFRASMRCQYIKQSINPYETVRIFVTTPQGQLFFTSGIYLVTEVSDSITPGRFLTTYQMIKSGTQSLGTLTPSVGTVLLDNESS